MRTNKELKEFHDAVKSLKPSLWARFRHLFRCIYVWGEIEDEDWVQRSIMNGEFSYTKRVQYGRCSICGLSKRRVISQGMGR